MDFITAITNSIKNQEKQTNALDFINNLISVDDNGNTIVLSHGNTQIRMMCDRLEILHDYYQSTKLVIEKDAIYVKWRNGEVLNFDDVTRMRDFFFREQPSQTSGGNADITPIAPIQYNSTNGELSVRSATSTQSGVLSNSDWISFNSKQAGSPELAGLSAITGDGVVFRASGNYSARGLTNADITGLGTIATQNENTVNLSGGAIANANINNCTIGQTTPNACKVTLLNIATPNSTTVPLTINTVNAGANTLEVRRQDNTLGFAILNSGSIEIQAGSFYRHSGNQVLGARRTGWTAMTGTASRTAIATSTATAPQVAERLKALIDDLITHGIIGG